MEGSVSWRVIKIPKLLVHARFIRNSVADDILEPNEGSLSQERSL